MQFLDQLCLKFKAEHSVAKAHNYIWGGDTAHTFLMGEQLEWGKNIYWERGGHRTYFVDGGNN